MRDDDSSAGNNVIVLADFDAHRERRPSSAHEGAGQVLLFTGVRYGAYVAPRSQSPKRASPAKGGRKRRSS